jgi:ferredoxin
VLRLTIDAQDVTVEPGQTILDAARKLGIDVPTLCFYEGPREADPQLETRNSKLEIDSDCRPNASCMVCAVRLGNGRLVPSCATKAEDGMVVSSECDDVRASRQAALELLLSDHVGDCMGPCHRVCPAHMDIPRMIRHIAAGELREALVTVKEEIALPAILGYVCPAPCEKGCRRGEHDDPVAICQLKRHVAEIDLARPEPYVPRCAPPSGFRVAVVGSGPAGLAAAYALQQLGHACVIFDDREQPGGNLRYAIAADRLPRAVLDSEIDLVRKMGAVFRTKTRLGVDVSLAELQQEFGAVLIATGEAPKSAVQGQGPRAKGQGDEKNEQRGAKSDERSPSLGPRPSALGPLTYPLKANSTTFATAILGVFAAGAVLRPGRWAIRSLAEGKGAAVSIDQYLRGQVVTGPFKPFTSRIGKVTPEEARLLLEWEGASNAGRLGAPVTDQAAPPALSVENAVAEALRCLHCDCRKADNCKLRDGAQRYDADQNHWAGERRPVEMRVEHPFVIYEPGKCVRCGICVQIATQAKETLGLTFVGRGFNVRVSAPQGQALAEGMRKVAVQCVQACPTAAMAFKDSYRGSGLP